MQNMQEEIIPLIPVLMILVGRLGFTPLVAVAMSAAERCRVPTMNAFCDAFCTTGVGRWEELEATKPARRRPQSALPPRLRVLGSSATRASSHSCEPRGAMAASGTPGHHNIHTLATNTSLQRPRTWEVGNQLETRTS